MIRLVTLLLGSAFVVALPGLALSRPGSGTHHHTADWSWVKNTYWYVTQEDLPAIATDLATQQHQLVSDQTVWHIQEYFNGYFWGKTVVELTGRRPLCLNMVGSITPHGNVHITFTLSLPDLPPELSLKTTGIGRTLRLRNELRFEMQMTTGVATLVTHWAYMRQCQEGEECNQRLPGANIPLQDFLAVCGE
jgi:hypothetical protein